MPIIRSRLQPSPPHIDIARACARLLALCLLAAVVMDVKAQTVTTSRTSVDVGRAGGQCLAGTCIEAQAGRTGICAVEVLDNSGSMNTNGRFAAAKAGISQFADSLQAERGDWFGLVSFNGPKLVFGGTPVSNPGPASVIKQVDPVSQDVAAIQSTLTDIETSDVSSLTPLAAGIEAAAEVLSGCPEGTLPVMIVSTDGLPNWENDTQCSVTPLSATSCTAAASDAAAAAKENGLHIITIGIDLDPNDLSQAFGISLLRGIATSPDDANFFNTKDGFGQADIFRHVATSVASPRDVRFTEPLPDSCWSYALGSTTGSTTDEPFVVTVDSGLAVSWLLGTLPDGETAGICYDMIYDQRCGESPSSVEVQPGGFASWTETDGSTASTEIASQTLRNIVGCQVVIPVELVDFRAISSDRAVTLVWNTASEVDNAGFGVERASREASFEQIDFVFGHGTSSAPHSYRFVDGDVTPGRYRYRLRQTDLDGAYTYSSIVEVSVELPQTYFMGRVYPNPLENEASFGLSVARTQNVRIYLLDMTGRLVRAVRHGPLEEGVTETVRLDTVHAPAGAYIVRIVGDYFSAAQLVTVVR